MSLPTQTQTVGYAIDASAITAGTSIVLLGPVGATGGERIYGLVASTQTCRIDVEISSDGGATFTIAKSVAGAAGNDATYTQVAELDIPAPSLVRISAKNTSGSTANFRTDVRMYVQSGH